MEKRKPIQKFGEFSWVVGLILLSLGTALAAKADFGVSMVVAPAYIISERTVLTFGLAGWLYEGVVLALLCIAVRRFRVRFLLSFVTSAIYGLALDFWDLVVFSGFEAEALWLRIMLLCFSLICVSLGVTFFFMSYLPQQICDLFVKETCEKYKLNRNVFKWIFDLASFALAVILALILFGSAWGHGIGFGTVAATLFNGLLIALFSGILSKLIDFSPRVKPVYDWFERQKS